MGCGNRVLTGEENAVLSDALVYAIMGIVGLPVDVHVTDGSIYSGIFHTASVENDYAVVLKKARMTKKGNHDSDLPSGGIIETLIVTSEDLVQVVAKGVVLAPDVVAGNVAGDHFEAVSGSVQFIEYPNQEAKSPKYSKSNADMMPISQTSTSHSLHNEDENLNGMDMANEKSSRGPIRGRQIRDRRSVGKQGDYREKSEIQRKLTTHVVQGSTSSFDACDSQIMAVENTHAKTKSKNFPNGVPTIVKIENDDKLKELHTSEDMPSSDVISSCISTSVAPVMDVISESCLSSLSTPIEMVTPKCSSSIRTAKEFKLNPRAKIFFPSFPNHISATPPTASTVSSWTCVPVICPMIPVATAQPEIETSLFAPCASLPVTFVPYGNFVVGNAQSKAQYSQPIIGQMGKKTRSVRYAGKYHSVRAGPASMHPRGQNEM